MCARKSKSDCNWGDCNLNVFFKNKKLTHRLHLKCRKVSERVYWPRIKEEGTRTEGRICKTVSQEINYHEGENHPYVRWGAGWVRRRLAACFIDERLFLSVAVETGGHRDGESPQHRALMSLGHCSHLGLVHGLFKAGTSRTLSSQRISESLQSPPPAPTIQ